ncbi:MAG: hypothetical protein GF384_05495 [Elusimicrobia bacterium]|nr:hypothetical protein [Elusimicrobiota bacterium]
MENRLVLKEIQSKSFHSSAILAALLISFFPASVSQISCTGIPEPEQVIDMPDTGSSDDTDTGTEPNDEINNDTDIDDMPVPPHIDNNDQDQQPQTFETPRVTVSGRSILVNDEPYHIRGLSWSPIGVGRSRQQGPDYLGTYREHIPRMQGLGINTIRVYNPIEEKKVLDALDNAGIKVITVFPYYDDRYNPGPDMRSGSYQAYIEKYKDHPAILFWELGNEYNYLFAEHPEWIPGGINGWYAVLQETAETIHRIDPNHPVSTAQGEVPAASVLRQCDNVDIWGMNVYRWDDPSSVADEWASLSGKPAYFSEAGTDARDNNANQVDEIAQAQAVIRIWIHVIEHDDILSGITFFTFQDEWWKAGDPFTHDPGGYWNQGIPYDNFANEEWWGWVDRLVFELMSRIWEEGEDPRLVLKELETRSKLFNVARTSHEREKFIIDFLMEQIKKRKPLPATAPISYIPGQDISMADSSL